MPAKKSKPHYIEQDDTGKGIWNRFQERLFILKLDRITREWREQIARKIRGLTSTGSEWRRQRINMQIGHLGTDLERVYQAGCEVWEKQGEEKTPELVRAAFSRVMLPVIEGRKAGVRDDIERYAASAGEIVPQGVMERLEHTAVDLIEDWRKRTEEEALELECGQASKARTRKQISVRTTHGTPAAAPKPSEARARTVKKIIEELNILKPQMFGLSDYQSLAQQNSEFLTFKVAERRPDLKEKVLNLQSHRQHVRLALELAAAHHGRQFSTVETDWKRHRKSIRTAAVV